MRNIDLTNIKEASEGQRLPVGGYICAIKTVTDYPAKDYLEIEYDIARGDFKGYYTEMEKKVNFWGGKFYRSYKDTALSFFKSFLTAVEKSNPGFLWTSNEKQLERMLVGLVLGEEEYINKDGEKKTRLYVVGVRSVEEIEKGNFKIPELKKIQYTETTVSQPISATAQTLGVIADEDLPF